MSSFEESEFGKPYGGGAIKGSSLPTSTGTADLGSLKHDSKGGYNIQPMGGSGGYTFMQVGEGRYISLICRPHRRKECPFSRHAARYKAVHRTKCHLEFRLLKLKWYNGVST